MYNKRIVLILILISAFAQAQHRVYHPLNKDTKAWAGYCSAYPQAKTIYAVDIFIALNRNDGNWSYFDRLWILGLGTSTSAVISLINPSSTAITLVNSPTFTAYQGLTGNGTSSYANTHFNPSSSGVNFTLDNASEGIYCRTNNGISGVLAFGSYDGTYGTGFNPRNASNQFGGRLNTNVSSTFPTLTDSRGFSVLSKTSANNFNYIKNGILLSNVSVTDGPLNNLETYLLCWNGIGTATAFDTRQYSLLFIGSGSINQSTLYNDVNKLAWYLGW